jgi:glycosyltransferase involved in cell wall biosynthesis
MSEIPSVCIMIPVYNQEHFIAKAVESALRQDYSNIEIIIADDNSTDSTAAIIANFLGDSSIKYKRNGVNLGRVANYRKCLYEYAKADWVINLDADDYFTNDQYISQAIDAIQKNGVDKTLFYQGVNIIKSDQFEKLNEPNIRFAEAVITADDYFLNYFERNYFSHMSTLYHRASAIASDFYSKDAISSDIFSLLQLCINNRDKCAIVSKNISGVWYQHCGNISKSLNLKKHYNNLRLYGQLSSLANLKGYSKWQTLNWLAKAGVIYIRSYLYSFVRTKN